jgi:uncharacterized membrane protein
MSNRDKKERRLVNRESPAVEQLSILSAFRKGPLPPPVELEKYEILYPGATKLLFDNFISQSDHRMELEKLVIVEDNKRANKSLQNSFIITISILLISTMLFIMGKDGFAIAASFTAIAPIVIAFITTTFSRRKDRGDKRKHLGV